MAIRLGFIGLAGVGKTTAAEYVAKQTGALMLSWANPLKLEVFDFLACPGKANPDIWFGLIPGSPELARVPFPPLTIENPIEKLEWVNANKKWLRPMLQWFGTEYRRGQNENYWTEQGAKFIDVRGPHVNIVSDDARFNNEGDVMKERGFTIIQINRLGIEAMDHASEKLEIKPHYIIDNIGKVSDFYTQIEFLMGQLYGR